MSHLSVLTSLPLWTMPCPNERGWTVVAMEECTPYLLAGAAGDDGGSCSCAWCRGELSLPELPPESSP